MYPQHHIQCLGWLLGSLCSSGWVEGHVGQRLRFAKLRQAGAWDPWLQCLHLDTPLLHPKIQRSHQGLKITTCMGNRGKFWITGYKKTKNPNATCEDLGAKAGYAPCTQNHHGVSRPSQPPLQSDPGHTPTLTPYKERVGKGTHHVFSLPPSATGASVKLSPTFPFWPGVNFY